MSSLQLLSEGALHSSVRLGAVTIVENVLPELRVTLDDTEPEYRLHVSFVDITFSTSRCRHQPLRSSREAGIRGNQEGCGDGCKAERYACVLGTALGT